MINRKYIGVVVAFTALTSLAVAFPALAETNVSASQATNWRGRDVNMIRPIAMGTVSAINGNTITMTSQLGRKLVQAGATIAPMIFTIDASKAVITKDNVVGTIANIVVGDTIAVQGTVTGTSILATKIYDGLRGPMNRGPDGKPTEQGRPVGNPVIQGNGQPVVAGNISTIRRVGGFFSHMFGF